MSRKPNFNYKANTHKGARSVHSPGVLCADTLWTQWFTKVFA